MVLPQGRLRIVKSNKNVPFLKYGHQCTLGEWFPLIDTECNRAFLLVIENGLSPEWPQSAEYQLRVLTEKL